MKKTLLNTLTFVSLCIASAANAQVGIGVPAGDIHPSAELEVKSTEKGFLLPRMTKAQRIAIGSPATGLIVYQTDGDVPNPAGLYYFDGLLWKNGIGAQGIQGPIGAVGPKGDTGPIGPQGIQGTTGANGATGSQGPIGPAGANGTNGAQGLPGAVGPQGVQGPIGPAGVNGTNGAQGLPGAQGIQGKTGDTGAQGPVGPAGANGTNGAQGSPGAKGDTGDQGPQGIQGLKGDKGDIGSSGPQGIQGLKGDTGTQGPQGPQGEVGPQGPAGVNGTNGTPGAKGDTGAQGIQGPIGPSGAKGETGAQGIQGEIGKDGLQGPKGDKGEQGLPGNNGVTGYPFNPIQFATTILTPGTKSYYYTILLSQATTISGLQIYLGSGAENLRCGIYRGRLKLANSGNITLVGQTTYTLSNSGDYLRVPITQVSGQNLSFAAGEYITIAFHSQGTTSGFYASAPLFDIFNTDIMFTGINNYASDGFPATLTQSAIGAPLANKICFELY
jgi:hypothetical protein